MSRETGPKYTPQKQAEIEKSRTLSDAELLKEGAEYNVNERGEKRLELTKEQIQKIKNTEDRETVLALVRKDPNALFYASEKLRADKEIVLSALKESDQPSRLLEIVSEELRNDKEVVLAAIRVASLSNIIPIFFLASFDLRNDKEVVLASIEKSPYVFKHTSEELRADKEVVLAAISGANENFGGREDILNKADLITSISDKKLLSDPDIRRVWGSWDIMSDPDIRRGYESWERPPGKK